MIITLFNPNIIEILTIITDNYNFNESWLVEGCTEITTKHLLKYFKAIKSYRQELADKNFEMGMRVLTRSNFLSFVYDFK